MQLVEAFAPSTTTWCSPSRLASPYTFGTRSAAYSLVERFPKSPIAMAMDPHFFSSILLSDEATQAISTAVDSLVDTGAEIVPKAANNGWFGFLTVPIELLLQGIHAILVTLGAQQNSWGLSILGLTLLIKILTYPLTKSQLESTNKMQAVAPAVKELQTKYASNPEVMNQKIAALYQEEKVNPLAGCLPALVQLPVFIGLYRAILNLSQENKLNEAFLWLPNLEGPVYGADPTKGSDWILKGWVDGVPSLGWEDTLAFLTLPVLLVVSQYISQALITPKNQDESQQQANAILQILPLMIGWFSLNVPAALGIYWVANNIISTAITLQVRSTFANATPSPKAAVEDTSSTFRPNPAREKPMGFASTPMVSKDEVKPITAPPVLDAEIVEQDTAEEVEEASGFAGTEEKKVRGKKKKGGKK